jgi:hypothetical protein
MEGDNCVVEERGSGGDYFKWRVFDYDYRRCERFLSLVLTLWHQGWEIAHRLL